MPADSVHAPGSRSTDFGETLPTPSRSDILLGIEASTVAANAANQFGKYQVIGELGEGGMGRVYKAVDTELGRVVAIKVLRSTDPFEASRFRGEAEMIASLDHPNIIKVYDIATPPDGRPYIVLEYCEGNSLDKELGGQPIEPRRAAEMVETLARAVQFAHEKGVIHRDLKPANILRSKDRQLKLTDFGLAKELEVSSGMTPSNAVMGTPSYMSPEQAEGKVKQLGPPTDVYGLGAILYELITGRPPFRGINMVDTLEQVRWAEPAPPSRLVPRLHRDLATICIKCLQKAPARRYATAAGLADDLRRWLNGETIAARRAPSWERFVRQVKRRPWEAAAIAAFLLLVVGAVAAGLYVHERNTLDERRQLREEARAADEHAKESLRRAAEDADRERDAGRRAAEARVRKQARDSLAALNNIRELILDGELSRKPGLDPLYRALGDYYDDLIEQKDSGFDTVELADGLVKVGDLFRRTGQKERAREAYSRAAAHCRDRAAADPKARGVLAAALVKGGQVSFELDDDKAVGAACDEADALLAPLRPAATGPIADPHAARQAAESLHLRGQLLRRKDEFAGAEAAYRQSIAVRTRLAEGVPADLTKLPPGERKAALAALTDLGRGYGFLGDALSDANKAADAEAAYWQSHAIRERVVAALTSDKPSAEELDARNQLARSWSNFASLHARSRALGTARYFARQSLDAHLKLVALDAINVEYRLDACNRLIQLAELDLQLWVRAGAKPDDPLRTEVLQTLDEARKVPSDQASAKDGRSRRASGAWATAVVLRAAVVADGAADPQAVRKELFDAYTVLGDLCKEQPGVTVDPLHQYYRLAAVLLLSELGGTPLTPDRKKQRLDELRAAAEKLGPGRKHPDDIEGFRPFRVLRDDQDFKTLMTDLRAKAAK